MTPEYHPFPKFMIQYMVIHERSLVNTVCVHIWYHSEYRVLYVQNFKNGKNSEFHVLESYSIPLLYTLT